MGSVGPSKKEESGHRSIEPIVLRSARQSRRTLLFATVGFTVLLFVILIHGRLAMGAVSEAESTVRQATVVGAELSHAVHVLTEDVRLAVTSGHHDHEHTDALLELNRVITEITALASPQIALRFRMASAPAIAEIAGSHHRAVHHMRKGEHLLAWAILEAGWHDRTRQLLTHASKAFVSALADEVQARKLNIQRTTLAVELAIALAGMLGIGLIVLRMLARADAVHLLAEERLRTLALTDRLTGLASRAYFEGELDRLIAKRSISPTSNQASAPSLGRGLEKAGAEAGAIEGSDARADVPEGILGAEPARPTDGLVWRTGSGTHGCRGRASRLWARLTRYLSCGRFAALSMPAGISDLAEPASSRTRALEAARRIALIVVNINEMRRVNNAFGHTCGDTVLREAARRLSHAFADACVARIAGDEFALIVPCDDGLDRLERRLTAALQAIGAPIRQTTQEVRITASAGYAELLVGLDADMVRKRADVALHCLREEEADVAGGVRGFDEAMTQAYEANLALERQLRQAIAQKDFLAHYQPIVDLASGRIVGGEALVRWSDAAGKIVPPAGFLPQLERMGLMDDLTWIMLAEATTAACGWKEPIVVSVNVPPDQVRGDFAERVLDVLREVGLPARRLQLELLESAVADGNEEALRCLAALRAAGVKIALDDFGVEYASFGQLGSLPIDKVKIDRSFVASMSLPPTRESNVGAALGEIAMVGEPIVRAALELGTAYGYEVIAEGIENRGQVARLLELGCTRGQGYHFAPPLPLAEFEDLLRRGRQPNAYVRWASRTVGKAA